MGLSKSYPQAAKGSYPQVCLVIIGLGACVGCVG
jgi:hypothetical protein